MTKEAIAHYEAALKEAFPSGATGDVFHHWNEARKFLEQAQPADEPVACGYDETTGNCTKNPCCYNRPQEFVCSTGLCHYKAQPAPVQKPVEHLIAAFRALAPHCTMHDITRFREVCRNVLATPPAAQRQWVGLTDEDYEELLKTRDWGVYLIEAVETKLKKKNHG